MGEFQRPPTAQAAVLAELRARILDGRLPGGTALRQEDLAAELGVSRVPVREALRTLEADGQVRYAAHRGYRVAELDIGELEEIYALRTLIEDDLARRALTAPADDARTAIRLAHADLAAQEAADPCDHGALAAANRAFHWAILRPGPRADRILATLWDASDTYRARWFADPSNVARGAADHRKILAAAQGNDADALIALLSTHRNAAVTDLRRRLGDVPAHESTG